MVAVAKRILSSGFMVNDREAGMEELLDEVDRLRRYVVHESGGQ